MTKRVRFAAAAGVAAYATGVVVMWDRVAPMIQQVWTTLGAAVGL